MGTFYGDVKVSTGREERKRSVVVQLKHLSTINAKKNFIPFAKTNMMACAAC